MSNHALLWIIAVSVAFLAVVALVRLIIGRYP